MRNIKKTSIAQMKDKKEESKYLAAATLTQAEQEQVRWNDCKMSLLHIYQNWAVIIKLLCRQTMSSWTSCCRQTQP